MLPTPRRPQKFHVSYTDGTEADYDSLAVAQAEIEETILGCDFAIGVDSISDSQGNEYGCTWSLKLETL